MIRATVKPRVFKCSCPCGWEGQRQADSAMQVAAGKPCPKCDKKLRTR